MLLPAALGTSFTEGSRHTRAGASRIGQICYANNSYLGGSDGPLVRAMEWAFLDQGNAEQ